MVRIDYTKTTLANGLQVIVHEDRALPIVAVNVWYHVGSKNEERGRTGFAHLFEHLMFEGSAHYDRGYFQPLQDAGASLNGSTNADRTNYWEVVPTGAVDLALWLESDRMGYLLPALTEAKFENQRNVVLNERRQNYENRPYGSVSLALLAALYPDEHPYSWATIGEAADLLAASLDDVAAFFRAYYHPANASLVLAGDIDGDRGASLAAKYFDEIPPGPIPRPVTPAQAALDGEIRLVLEDRVELPRLYLAWHSAGLFGDGDAELDLAADALGSGKTSRLYRALVYDSRIATDVAAGQASRELAGFFQVTATAAPGFGLAPIEEAINRQLHSILDGGLTDAEMTRGRARAEAHFVYRLQNIGGFGGRSDQLNAYNVYLGDPGSFDRDLGRYLQATPEGILDAARSRLRPDRRVALSVVPRGRLDLALPGSRPVVVT